MKQTVIFNDTRMRLDDAFQVRHIATFPVQTCSSKDQVDAVLAEFGDFDQIPVANGDDVVEVIEREGARKRPIALTDVVSAYEPLAKFLPMLEHSPYRLVTEGGKVTGIVTRSDTLKLPVRLLAFMMITHLEMLMADLIRARYPDSTGWRRRLSEERRARIDQKEEELRQPGNNPEPLELTDFADKREIVRVEYDLPNRFQKDLGDIERVRNSVAHAGNYAQTEDRLRKFVKRIRLADKWIEELSRL
ncbi:MAG: CBS domain-containing protein [Anaerolineae bacterium]